MRQPLLTFLSLLLPMTGQLWGQTVYPSLESKTDSLQIATALHDTVRSDTTAAQPVRVSGVDSVVSYSSTDSIVYSFHTRMMKMYGKGDVRHKQMRLKAEEIDVNWEVSVMYARGVIDTVDTTAEASGSPLERKFAPKARYRGSPIMIDGGEEYRGQELSYNFKTQRGKINIGDTELDQGYYHGEAIKKIEKDAFFVEDGRYTTCDANDPHYYFFSPKMKVIMQDKVVAEPVYLYIADVPVFALPLGVFPNKSGRRSGIITPAYGEDGRRGRYLSHFGYYWAMNDYMDLSTRGDWYMRGGWSLFSDYRYALRYHFGGSVSGEYKNLHTGEKDDPDRTEEKAYRVSINHHQDFNPTTRLDVNFTFASNNSYLATNSLQQALEQAIFSNATLSKSWEGTPNSMSINVSRRQNLRDGSIDETLPSLSFNRSHTFPFRAKKRGGSFGSPGEEGAWYELIGYSYGAQFANSRSKINQKIGGIKETTGGVVSLVTVEDFGRSSRQQLSQNINVNASPKLGYITITPSASFRDDRSWSSASVPQRNPADSSLTFADTKNFQAAGFFASGVSAGTRFYGIFQPNALGIAAFRHTVNPSLSLTYSKQVYGRNLPPKQLLASFNVGNVFEMKTSPTVREASETAKENAEGLQEGKKIQLVNLGAGISYDFAADSLNFSPVGVSFRTDIGSVLNVSGSSNFDLYKFDESIRPNGQVVGRVNKFLINEEGRLARMTSFSVSLSTSLSGERKKSSEAETPVDTSGMLRSQASGYYGLQREEEPDLSIPWSLQLSWDFSESKVPGARFRSSNLRGSLGFNLTEHWKISTSGAYDVLNKELAAPSIDIYRDLHCWEMLFNWIPIGNYRSFKLEIRVKASQLQDIKITKQRSSRGIY
jgi:lipopolysaccharide assembly outer membrane protein LptD (OstA)